MPLYKKIKPNKDTLILVWEITESLESLKLLFDKTCPNQIVPDYSYDNRLKEWYSVRLLLNKNFNKEAIIKYEPEGKPFLPGLKESISITHTKQFSAIIISSKGSPGIDIEALSERILKVKHKFIPCNMEVDNSNIRKIYSQWCGKEVMVKVSNDKKAGFIKDLSVLPHNAENKCFGVYRNRNNLKIELNEVIFRNHILVWSSGKAY